MNRAAAFGAILGVLALTDGARAATPSIVQCPSIQQGEEIEPQSDVHAPDLAVADAAALTLYVSANHAVLAPSGWHCFEDGGSSGSFLFVSPREMTPDELFKGPIDGPAVQTMLDYAGTSGRFSVAQVDAQLFPEKSRFVQSVIDEGIRPASDFPSGPVPSDKLTNVADRIVEFVTPPNHEGMGTASWLKKGPLFIQGAAVLGKGEGDIERIVIRLPAGREGLDRTILADFEKGLTRQGF